MNFWNSKEVQDLDGGNEAISEVVNRIKNDMISLLEPAVRIFADLKCFFAPKNSIGIALSDL